MVYITEAHPSDVWQMESNIRDKVVFASPKNEEERASLAGTCVRRLGLKFPAVLDEFGNSTEQAYTGWPDRIYLIDSNGKVGRIQIGGGLWLTKNMLVKAEWVDQKYRGFATGDVVNNGVAAWRNPEFKGIVSEVSFAF